jgi:hypothetical protein
MRHAAHNTVDRYELLLDGGPGSDALSHVLAAVTAAGTQDELLGLPAARSAFLAAQAPTAAPARATTARRRPAASRTVAGRLLAAKAVAAVSGITLVGGVAYAATTTSIFHPAPRHGPQAPAQQQGPSGSSGAGTTTTGGVTGPANVRPIKATVTKTVTRTVTPPGNAYGHNTNGPAQAKSSPHHPANPAHQPGVGASAAASAPGRAKTPTPKKSHPAHPSHPSGPHAHSARPA